MIKSLLKIITSHPLENNYLYSLNHVAISSRILMQILKNNFDTYTVVEKTINRLKKEIQMFWVDKSNIKCVIEPNLPINNA